MVGTPPKGYMKNEKQITRTVSGKITFFVIGLFLKGT